MAKEDKRDGATEQHTDLTPDEFAAVFRVGRTQVIRWLRAGRVSGFKVGKVWRIPESEVRRVRAGKMNPPR